MTERTEILSCVAPTQLVLLATDVCSFIPPTKDSYNKILELLKSPTNLALVQDAGDFGGRNWSQDLVESLNIISAAIVRAWKINHPSKPKYDNKPSKREYYKSLTISLENVLGSEPVVTFAALDPANTQGDTLEYRCDMCRAHAETVCVMPMLLQDEKGQRRWKHQRCTQCSSMSASCSKYRSSPSKHTVGISMFSAEREQHEHPLVSRILSQRATETESPGDNAGPVVPYSDVL